MAIALDPAALVDYVLEDERNAAPAERTTWRLKRLTVRDEERIGNAKMRSTGDGGFQLCAGTEELETLRAGLAGVSNFLNYSGGIVPFDMENGYVSDAFLNRIPKNIRQEIAAEIRRLSTLSIDEKKP